MPVMSQQYPIICFDADDTLWVNEPYFREVEHQFCLLLSSFMEEEQLAQELFQTEMDNLEIYGYGVKGFILSMIETAMRISNNQVEQSTLAEIVELGKKMLNLPVVLLDGVEETLQYLKSQNYKLIVATKGDLLDQERKLQRSGIAHYFHHIEVMSEKKVADYRKLLAHLDISPQNFLMIGNSLKSDVLPLTEIGANAIHIPYHTTWQHEIVNTSHNKAFKTLDDISLLKELL